MEGSQPDSIQIDSMLAMILVYFSFRGVLVGSSTVGLRETVMIAVQGAVVASFLLKSQRC